MSIGNLFQMLLPSCLSDLRPHVVELDLGIIVLEGSLRLYSVSFTALYTSVVIVLVIVVFLVGHMTFR